MQKAEKTHFYVKLKDENLRKAIFGWWKQLQNDKGHRAQLKRCGSPADALLHQETYQLMQILPNWASAEASGTIAGILAHIESNNSSPLGSALAGKKDGRILFSETRFRQLLSCRDWDELYTTLRRAVGILNGNVHFFSIVDVILQWDENEKNPRYKKPNESVKFNLSKEYYTELLKHDK